MFLKKNVISMLLVVCCFCEFYILKTSATHCSLDRMKKFAMDACEHLGVRERRSIGFGSTNTYTPKYWVNISRGNYPFGGYLKVGQEHYNRLSLLDHFC
ncbi:hypothetical protein DOY81_006763 [Sarcophaga bullata]|nr:hypothetical protein DOY81_006763 [Sarcophaga bullata]